MNSKKWCIAALSAVILSVLSVAALNIYADPFGSFGTDLWYSCSETNNPRTAKISYLKKNHDKYDSYIIGCSSSSSYPVEDFNKYLGAKFYNMIFYGSDMYDSELLVYYLINNYEVKNIVLNVYISNGFNYDRIENPITNAMHCDVTGESKLSFYTRFAYANPKYSLKKLKNRRYDRYLSESFDVFDEETGAYDKRKRDAQQITDLYDYYKSYPAFLNYPKDVHHLLVYEQNGQSIKRIKDFCEEHNVNLIVMNSPVYSEYFEYVPKEDILKFYTEIANASDFWDFSYSSVSFDPRNFYDETHLRNDIGSMAAARIFSDDSVYIPSDFGKLVTKDNVVQYVDSLYTDVFPYKAENYTKKVPVLLYHHIADKAENNMTVSAETFSRHIKTLSDNGYVSLSLSDIINYIEKGIDLPEKCVLITFDDGYESNYKYAFPVLLKYNYKAVFFTIGSSFGKNTYKDTDFPIIPHFGYEQMKEMENTGLIDIQSHTYDLHQSSAYENGRAYENILILDGESDEDYVKRLKDDLSNWENTTGKKAISLAFPHGESDLFSQAVLNECGIKLTFSTNPKTDTIIKGLHSSGYNIGRYTIADSVSDEELLNLVSQ